jgi:predicted homoserine dehydrogenase-like protein
VPAITIDPFLLTDSDQIDVIVEATGEVEYGARVIMRAIEHKKDVILLNTELDGTLGPILKAYADRAGVVYTQADGDQPAVMMNLYRYVQSIGFKPVMAGNIKSLLDHRRTPETQRKWADEHFQRPKVPTAAADGTKISFENATVANATGFRVGKRGMYGPKCASVNDAPKLFPMEQLMNGGLVDYILGAEPSFGVFVLGYSNHPIKQRYMNVYKMGDGPLYTFYTPYHLSPLETPLTVARVAGFRDAALAPKGGLVCEVITIAKRDLKKGETLDGIGGFTCYGTMENADVAARERLLPMGLSEDCVLKRDLPMDVAVTYDDVVLPSGRLADQLRAEQDKQFPQVS